MQVQHARYAGLDVHKKTTMLVAPSCHVKTHCARCAVVLQRGCGRMGAKRAIMSPIDQLASCDYWLG
jgi:hypothetical protein